MSITLYEKVNSREVSASINSYTEPLRFIAQYSTDQAAVEAALLAGTPVIWDGVWRQKTHILHLGGGVWDCEVEYGFSAEQVNAPEDKESPDDTTALGPEFAFDITAQQAHITQSLATISKTGEGLTAAPDYHQAIGVTSERIEGTEAFLGHMEWSCTIQIYPVQLPYLRLLMAAVGCTNNATWFNFPRGSLMFLGATGSCKPGNIWTVTYKFACAPNKTSIKITPTLTVPAKKGFEYVWCTYKPKNIGGVLVQVAAAAYVEQIQEEIDFTTLGLGGP